MSSSILPPDFNKPVLIYVKKKNCPACDSFHKNEWPKLRKQIFRNGVGASPQDTVRLVTFEVETFNDPIWAVLTLPSYWTPTFILAAPKSYFRVFTEYDKLNTKDYREGYRIKSIRYNAGLDKNHYVYNQRPDTAENISAWVNNSALRAKLLETDEPTIPSLYR